MSKSTFKPLKDWYTRQIRRLTVQKAPVIKGRRVNLLRIRHIGSLIHYKNVHLVSSPITVPRAPVVKNATDAAGEVFWMVILTGWALYQTFLERLKRTKPTDWFVYSLQINQKVRDFLYRIWNDI